MYPFVYASISSNQVRAGQLDNYRLGKQLNCALHSQPRPNVSSPFRIDKTAYF